MNEPPNPEVAVFAAALELAADQRGAYLDQACVGDAALRRQDSAGVGRAERPAADRAYEAQRSSVLRAIQS